MTSACLGRVVERFALARSRVTVTFGDGRVDRQTVHEGRASLVPLPGWTRWGRLVAYPPYASVTADG